MLKYLCKSSSMEDSFVSKWFGMTDKDISGKSIYSAVSMQLSWHAVSGFPNGKICIEFSNDRHSYSTGAEINVDNTNNQNNAEIALLNRVSKFCRIRFVNNDITNGNLDAVLYLEKK